MNTATGFLLGLTTKTGEALSAGAAEEAIGDYLWSTFKVGCTFVEMSGYYRGVRERALFVYVSGINSHSQGVVLEWLVKKFEQSQVGTLPTPALLLYPEFSPAEAA